MPQIPQNFLFRLRFPIKRAPEDLNVDVLPAEALDHSYRIPFWSLYSLPEGFDKRSGEPGVIEASNPDIEDRFDFRAAWSNEGLFFTIVVAQKNAQRFWTHTDLRIADCVRLCLDTRDVKEIHRGSRFCHKFLFYPLVGESEDVAKPYAQWAPINRAKASPNAVDVSEFRMATEKREDGYAFSVFVPGTTLTGFDPEDLNRVGFHYVVRDSQFGAFVLQHSEPAPCEDDPSLWATLVLA